MTWRSAILGYLALALVLCFFRLGSTGAIHNEGIVADGARHMARTGDLLVPHFYEEPYTYKPPLTNWLVLASFELTGVENTWTLRAPNALVALSMGLAVLLGVGRLRSPRSGLLCALATLTTGLGLEKMRIAEYDLPLAAGVGVAALLAGLALSRERGQLSTWLLCYAALLFGFLAKGTPAAMIFFAGLVAAAWLTGRTRVLGSWRHLVGLTLFALTVALYLWLTARAGPAGVFDQPLAEAGARGLRWDLGALALTAVKPLAAFAAFLPWSAFLPLAWLGLRELGSKNADAQAPEIGLLRAGLGFLIGGALVLVVVPTFEVRYFYPLAVPIGLVAGLAADRFARPRTARWVTLVALGLWAVYVFALFPRRAESRGFESAADRLGPGVPEAAWLWVPVNETDEESLLVFHLDRPAIRLRPGQTEPLPGSLALLTPEQLAEVDPGSQLRWSEVARAGNENRRLVLSRLELVGCEPSPSLHERRVFDLYTALLDRPPSPSESTRLAARLEVGTPLAEAARELIVLPEFVERRRSVGDEAVALQVVRGILDREPIRDGLVTVIDPLKRGHLHTRVADMMRRDEYLARRPYCLPPPA